MGLIATGKPLIRENKSYRKKPRKTKKFEQYLFINGDILLNY
jgi:hypothetical protein